MIIKMEHMRAVEGFTVNAGFCSGGIRRWFAARGLDYSDFLKNGLDEAVFLQSGDPMAVAVVVQAYQRDRAMLDEAYRINAAFDAERASDSVETT